MVFRKCFVCRKEYLANPVRLKHGRETTCSRECSYKRRGRILGDSNKGKSPVNKKDKIVKKCKECSQLMSLYPYEVKNGREFCSKQCANINKDEGKTPEATKIRMSKKYADWRTSVFERDDYTCKICEQIGGKLNADHIMPFCLYPDKRLDINNGRTLCEDCHRQTATFGNKALKFSQIEA